MFRALDRFLVCTGEVAVGLYEPLLKVKVLADVKVGMLGRWLEHKLDGKKIPEV